MNATHAYVGIAECGCIRAVITDSTLDGALKLTAQETARWIRDGLTLDRMTLEAFRARKMTRPDCTVHAVIDPHRQEALL